MTKKKIEDGIVDLNFNTDVEPINELPFSEAQEISNIVKSEPSIPPIPSITDIEWSGYVMSEFKPEELHDGLPKVNGLRRLVRKLIGPILKGKVKIKQVPTIDNEQRATAEYKVVVLNKYQLENDEDQYIMEFTDAADAWRGNMWVQAEEYARFPVAMASTRAEARALRKALNLGVVAAEEISDQPLEESGFSGKITESQISKIDIKCEHLDINFLKFVNSGKIKYKKVDDILSTTAIKMFKMINRYQQGLDPIPDNLKGYDPNWRSS